MAWIDNFWQATTIMVIGMGVVFLFLAILILMMQMAARVIAKFAPPPEPAQPGAMAAAPARGDDGAVVAAIAAAVKQYTADKQNRPT